jgi:methylmalonyl-CoA mutase cobalamin-binding subunit
LGSAHGATHIVLAEDTLDGHDFGLKFAHQTLESLLYEK